MDPSARSDYRSNRGRWFFVLVRPALSRKDSSRLAVESLPTIGNPKRTAYCPIWRGKCGSCSLYGRRPCHFAIDCRYPSNVTPTLLYCKYRLSSHLGVCPCISWGDALRSSAINRCKRGTSRNPHNRRYHCWNSCHTFLFKGQMSHYALNPSYQPFLCGRRCCRRNGRVGTVELTFVGTSV